MSTGNPYQPTYSHVHTAAQADLTDRLSFIRKTYFHLAAAIIGLILIEFILFNVFPNQLHAATEYVLSGQYTWLFVLGGFMAVSWLANYWAQSSVSKPMQYAGLGLYVVAESIILAPLLYIASIDAPGAIATAGVLTAIIFIALTAFVFVTKKDFSFMRNVLMIAGFAAMAFITVSILFPVLGLGGEMIQTFFSIAMVALASGYILYYTSNVMNHYHTDQYVAASLALFAAVALLFWYILRLVMAMRR